MAFLINRNPPARPQCLHALCQLASHKFKNIETTFNMKELKFDPEKLNIHQFCSNLVENETMNLKYCPYKENPLDPAGCSLTNGVDADTTKSKEISNT